MATATGLLREFTVTPAVTTAAYANGDILFISTEIKNVFRSVGIYPGAVLNSIKIYDTDDEAATLFDLVFTRKSVTTAAANAPDTGLSDADLQEVEAVVTVDSSSDTFFDAANGRFLYKGGLALQVEGTSGSASLFVYGINRTNTPTYATTSSLVFRFGFTQD
jgi:hypothetical protein